MTTTLLNSLRAAKLLPSEVIPADFQATFNLGINFPTKQVCCGTLVRVSEVKQAPVVSISPAASNACSGQGNFTFMLIDPDAPTPDDPKFGYWRHWVVTNIPFPAVHPGLTISDSSFLGAGRTLTPYLAPGPKDESGPHRYLFLLLSEPEGLRLDKSDVGGEEFAERRSFKAEEFFAKNGLRLVGVQWMRGVGDGWKGE